MPYWYKSFRLQMAIVFGSVSLLLALSVALYINAVATAHMTDASEAVLHEIGRTLANNLEHDLTDRQREIALLARMPPVAENDLGQPETRAFLDSVKGGLDHYAWIGIADRNGIVRAAADGLLVGQPVHERSWFVAGQQADFVGDVHKAALLAGLLPSNLPDEPLRLLDFASPIRDADGTLRGVLAMHAPWSWVNAIITQSMPDAATRAGIESFIVNGQGEVLHPYHRRANLPLPDREVLQQGNALMDWGNEGRYLTASIRLHSNALPDIDWLIIVRQPASLAMAPIDQLHRTLVLLGLLASALFMLIAYWLATRYSRPIEKLAAAVQRIEHGDEYTRFDEHSDIKEIRHLILSVRGMTTTLIKRQQALEAMNATLERKVDERTAELSDLYNNAPVGYHASDANGIVRQINDRELQLLGYARHDVVGKLHVTQLLVPACRPLAEERMARLRAGLDLPPQDAELLRKDGSSLPVRLSSTAVRDAEGHFVMTRTAVMDASELRKLELELQRQQILNESIIHASSNGLLLYREDGQCVLANAAAAEIVGATVEALLRQNFHNLQSWRANGWYEKALRALQGEQDQLLVSTVSSFGKPIDSMVTLVPMRHDGQPMLLVVLKDVSALVKANRELEQLARHDTLTGLFNRLAANQRLREEFLRMKRSGKPYAAILMDIDHFKLVNDTYGHETGDHVLKQVAATLRESVRETDFIARFGGEEFLAVLPDTDPEGARVLAEKIRTRIEAVGMPLVGRVTLSLGLSPAAADDANEDAAVRRADQALYQAKHAGRNRVCLLS